MRILVIGDIHFIDEKGFQINTPIIQKIDKIVILDKHDDPDDIGEHYLSCGYNSYTTVYNKKAYNLIQENLDKLCAPLRMK